MTKKPSMIQTVFGNEMKPASEWQMNILGYDAYFKLCKAKASKNPFIRA